MTKQSTLRERVEDFIAHGSKSTDLQTLLKECISDGSLDALLCVARLYEDMYQGYTFNLLLKWPAAVALLFWKEAGLLALEEAARKSPTYKNISIALQVFATVAANATVPALGKGEDKFIDDAVQHAISSAPHHRALARAHLVKLVLSFQDDDEVASYVGTALNTVSSEGASPARELFAAVSKRWLAVNTPVLNAFEELIRTTPDAEPAFQHFLTAHPQILDPLAVRVWPQPNLFGFKEPDFVVQRADGTYLVVEIECPQKAIVTAGAQLSADATHAEQQAMDYRRYLIQKFADAAKHFPDFQEPDCLVVIGVERGLSPKQAQALQDVNRHRNHLRIVGFDWLLERSRTIASNITQSHVEIIPLRVV